MYDPNWNYHHRVTHCTLKTTDNILTASFKLQWARRLTCLRHVHLVSRTRSILLFHLRLYFNQIKIFFYFRSKHNRYKSESRSWKSFNRIWYEHNLLFNVLLQRFYLYSRLQWKSYSIEWQRRKSIERNP